VRRFFLLMTLAVFSPLLFPADAMAQDPPKQAAKDPTKVPAKNAYRLLPAGTGRAVMIRVCSQCHTPERAATERHDLDGWNHIIDQMANNGAQASDDEFDQIALYLAKSFPPGKKK
jgi:mono/diheme cytochrome c family protein